MTVVIDANVLLRFADATAAQHSVAVAALSTLRAQGHALRTIPQSIYEFWVVATRPVANTGPGGRRRLVPTERCPMTITVTVSGGRR
jgi:hypothetical protein